LQTGQVPTLRGYTGLVNIEILQNVRKGRKSVGGKDLVRLSARAPEGADQIVLILVEAVAFRDDLSNPEQEVRAAVGLNIKGDD
jgi:hypothetical protein